jgi:hypothetical protein
VPVGRGLSNIQHIDINKVSGEILSEPVNLVHPFMQNRHDADVAVEQLAPIDEVMLVAKEETVDAKLDRNGLRGNTVGGRSGRKAANSPVM